MYPTHWKENLINALENFDQSEKIELIFTEFLEITYKLDWKGACHESTSVIHILLNELGINNNWKIGEVFGNECLFDHSWIEIDNKIFDIAITKTLFEKARNAPIINDIDINKNCIHNIEYGIKSGQELSPETQFVMNIDLSDYLSNSPINPTYGTWAIILDIGKKLNLNLDIKLLIKKYKDKFYKEA
ncbi:hypothetical protein [Flavobacterium columnare]|uniref:Microcin J25-processing protein McjB C-terminal domain-containing protein n=1 Tax=Flavobacterium columnare TaxID=996 RepID=A0AAI8CGX6_9FLAO|nr:hypothetical protein [Flavobacterium columnare]AMO19763.1 hypothetical protein UN65_04845 [Flavobacterium columnare]AUX17694.1 hypothetical protein AQ623_04945 [Flavobacterium columnare]QOG56756.1 hypothetical protein HUE29_04900 [Flavobacterium columnare]QOG59481.1 hypothetical protein HUE30_04905 [Flavobacterium columnare]QOG62201.1 hypothetical protein HUE31_04905 [Flavobacterium columnare]